MAPNLIDATGLTTATQAELVTSFTIAMQRIYGPDIDLSSSSPDGQMMNIFIQAVLDNLDLQTGEYNTFDPDKAMGVILDSRVAYNGIQRLEGKPTITNITVITDRALSLPGLDQTISPPYTIADQAGNQWQLITSQTPVGIGTYVYAFQADTPGANVTIPNTITVPVTIVLGVVSVNNPTTFTTLGINEESDAALKIRRQKSVSLGSQGYFAGLVAALENINGVTSVKVYENDTGATSDGMTPSNTPAGIPRNSIWVIVAGTATSAAIANAIYTKRNAGCGMLGVQTYIITQVDGSPFAVFWDIVVAESLFIAFKATSLDGVNPPNIAAIQAALSIKFVPGANAEVNINQLATLVQSIDPNTLVTFITGGTPAAGGFSLSSVGAYTSTLIPSAANKQFSVSAANTIILPMILSPFNPISLSPVNVPHTLTQQFTGLGGFGALVYSFVANLSGGSINAGTGLYTAGAAGFQDTILVIDSLGNTAQALVDVT